MSLATIAPAAGRKRVVLIDTQGDPLAVQVVSAEVQDRDAVRALAPDLDTPCRPGPTATLPATTGELAASATASPLVATASRSSPGAAR